MVYRLPKCTFEVYRRTYALDLQGRGAAAGAKVVRCNFVSTAGAEGRLNTGNLTQTFGAQPHANPAAADATRGKQKVE
jgi:hypothetical protein